MKSHVKKYSINNNYQQENDQIYPIQQEFQQKKEDMNFLNSSGDNPDLIDTDDLNFNTNNSNRSFILCSQKNNKILDSQDKGYFSKNKKINTVLEATCRQDKFINGAIIAIKSQNLALKYVVDNIKELTDRTVSEGYVRKVWDYWIKFKDIYFSTTNKTRMYTKHEAIQLYDALFKQYNPTTTSQQSVIPKIKEVLQKHAITKKLLMTYTQFEEVKGLDTEETYMSIKDAIDSGNVSTDPKWVDVSVRMMISASQFEYKKQIEIQCFNKLKNYLQYSCIQLIGVVMGETLNGRGKFIYIHCKYDQSIIKRNKYLKRFLLEVIPDWFYSYNCVHSQKIAIFRFQKFISIQCKFTEVENRKKYIPTSISNSQVKQAQRGVNQSLNVSYSSSIPFNNNNNNSLINTLY